jgi:hypothetical protein
VYVSQSILEILKTITIVIVFKISKMDCDSTGKCLQYFFSYVPYVRDGGEDSACGMGCFDPL